MTHSQRFWHQISRSRRTSLALAVLGTLALLAIFAEFIAADAPLLAVGRGKVDILPGVTHAHEYEDRSRAEIDAMHAGDFAVWPLVRHGPRTSSGPSLAPPSDDHPLGTDERGRDLLARLVYSARTALGLSLGAVLCGMLLGVTLGALAGYYRGFWDDRLVRLVETVDTFPAIIVVALVRAIEREPSALSLVIGVAIVRWAEVARLMRAEVMRVSAEDYVAAARALGNPPVRIVARHVLPNAIGPVVVSSVFGVASVVLLEAAISFLEMGGAIRSASWGETLAEGARHPDALRLTLWPGAALLLTVGSTYLFADSLRDALDPKTARRRVEDLSPLSRVLAPSVRDGRT